MKNTIFLAVAGLFFGASAQAQSTVDSIAAKYKLQAMPEALTPEKTFPVVGTYQLSGTDSASALTISLDPFNKGIIWVEGLPQGKVKAYLKQSPSTYRILSQKGENGKQIPEGTLIYDKDANLLNIAMGAPYKEEDPAGIFSMATNASNDPEPVEVKTKTKTSKTKTKTKAKVYYYSASKVQAEMSTMNATQQ